MMCEFAKYMTPIYEFWIKIMQAIFAIKTLTVRGPS